MRILIFAALYHPFEGGYAESIHEVAKGLTERGHRVAVITCDTHHQPLEEMRDGVIVWRIACWNPERLNETFPIPRPLAIWQALKKLKRQPFDIVSIQTRFFPITWLGFFFAKFKKIPVVHTERGSQHPNSHNVFISLVGQLIDHTFGWLVCRFADRVVGVSQAACDFTKHLGAKNPISIYNSISCDFWHSPANWSRSDSNKLEVTFVGRLIYAKGVQDLLKAIALLKLKTGLKVNIIGDGPYRAELEKLTMKLNLQDRILFLAKISRQEIRKIFETTDIFVNPSYSEGLPRSVLEAAAAGLPIIATDVGGTKEIITSEYCGILVKPQDIGLLAGKINLLAGNVELRKKMSRNIQKQIKGIFDQQLIVDQYLKVFKSLCAE